MWRCLNALVWVSHQMVLNICDWHIWCAIARVWFCVRRSCSIHTWCSWAPRTQNVCLRTQDIVYEHEMIQVCSVDVAWCIFGISPWMLWASRMFSKILPPTSQWLNLLDWECTIGSVGYGWDGCSWSCPVCVLSCRCVFPNCQLYFFSLCNVIR